MVSPNLLWRPWVTARISESLSNISFLMIILNVIFHRSLKYEGCLSLSARQTLFLVTCFKFDFENIYRDLNKAYSCN